MNGVEANGCPRHRPRTSALGRLCMYPQAAQPALSLCWKSIEKNGTIKPLLPNKSRFPRHPGTYAPGVNLSGTWRPGWVLGNRCQRVSLSPHWPVAGSFLLSSCSSLALMPPEVPARQGICTGQTSIQTCCPPSTEVKRGVTWGRMGRPHTARRTGREGRAGWVCAPPTQSWCLQLCACLSIWSQLSTWMD